MAANPIGFHAERKRRVSEKEVRLIDGQILCRSMPRVSFLSIRHSSSLNPPSLLPCSHSPPQGEKKQNPGVGARGMVEYPKRSEEGEREE